LRVQPGICFPALIEGASCGTPFFVGFSKPTALPKPGTDNIAPSGLQRHWRDETITPPIAPRFVPRII